MIKKSFLRPSLFDPSYLIRNSILSSVLELSSYIKGNTLDFGCGSMPYRSVFSVDSYIGLEHISSNSRYSSSDGITYYDGTTFPFASGLFDSIFSSETFEHIFNLPRILSEMNRVLKPEGHLLITMPFVWPEHEQPFDFARYTSFGISRLLEEAGFSVLHVKKNGSYPYVIIQITILFLWSLFNFSFPSKVVCSLLFCAPLNLLALTLHSILPGRSDLPLSISVLACKK